MPRPTSLLGYCTVLLTSVAFYWPVTDADSLSAAQHLLQVSDTRRHYETRTTQQTNAIIRSYSSIVSMAVDLDIPDSIKQHINNCYMEVYAWENFEHGLTQILADHLTLEELQLLAGFYDNLGLPPGDIQLFKDIIAKSSLIQEKSLEYMWSNSASCVEQDAALILDYVMANSGSHNANLASAKGI